MTHHTKLRLEEREFLAEKLAAGWSQARIAKALGRSGSTIAVGDLKTKTVIRVIYRRLKAYPPEWRQSLTLEEREFRGAGWLTERLGLQVFFTDPHSPWQRGSNENFNGLVRQIFPKGTMLSQVSRSKVAKAQHLLNTRPRKRLAYQTPQRYLPSKRLSSDSNLTSLIIQASC